MPTHSNVNRAIRDASPALDALLSELGRAAEYPPDIPFQAAQARSVSLNATIGQITDGSGGILALKAVSEQLGSLADRHLDAALLYSPVEGDPELRRLWARHHRPSGAAGAGSSLPLVTIGLTEALSLVADLCCDRGRAVLVPAPFWGNYRQIFGLRRGASIVPVEVIRERRFEARAIVEAVHSQPEGEPVVLILNFPSNPLGYSPTVDERTELVEGLVRAAEARPILAICDDAYSGLVFEDGVPSESLYWSLVGRHPSLLPVKIDGATKELVLFGARVGFLTFPFPRDSAVAIAVESKLKCLLRASVGSPVALSQRLVVETLRTPGVEDEVATVREILGRRYRCLKEALAAADPRLLRPVAFNSGCFAVLDLPDGLDSEKVRRRLLADYDTGVVSLGGSYLRLAYCSVKEESLGTLIERIESCLSAMLSE